MLMEEDLKDDATLPVKWELGVVTVQFERRPIVLRGAMFTPFVPLALRI